MKIVKRSHHVETLGSTASALQRRLSGHVDLLRIGIRTFGG